MAEKRHQPKTSRARNSWRDYQKRLKRPRRAHRRRWVIAIPILIAVLYTLWAGLGASAVPNPAHSRAASPHDTLISKQDVQLLLANLNPKQLLSEQVQLPISNQHLKIETSLNLDLQNHLLGKMDEKNSSLIGIAVMDAESGRILAMAGFNKTNPDDNPCLNSTFPAASIFKIVTAAAAVDHCGYSADTPVRFNGYQHTLYKSQLKEKVNRHTNVVSFKNSFAQSINPVFGKIGVHKLGKTVLEEYAQAFGFNQPIGFELPLNSSHLTIAPTAYHWAEIASGFNRDTTISPIHGAMMASAVLNNGRMVTPTMVDRITDKNGDLLYANKPGHIRRAMTSRAARVMADLMETTVRSGTARKSFRNTKRHKVLSKLQIGGKTGSIYNRNHDARYDWFVGYAKEKQGVRKLAISVLVAHEEYIGTRATAYARMAITHYFKTHFAHNKIAKKTPGS